jgi:hypothetical protein
VTPCMPCSFGLLPHPRSGTGAQPNALLGVTVAVRWIPLVTAAYGTRVARPARTTRLTSGGAGSQLGPRVRPVAGDHRLVGRAPRARGSRVGRLELHVTSLPRPRSGGYRSDDLRFLRTSGDRSCPPLSVVRLSAADPARTKRVQPSSARDALSAPVLHDLLALGARAGPVTAAAPRLRLDYGADRTS